MIDRRKLGGLLVVMLVSVLTVACSSETKVGTLVAFKVSFSLSDAADGQLDSVEFAGAVVVELDDGTRVDAAVRHDLAEVLQGGDRLEIAPLEESEYWEVVRIVESDG